jgi:hypothetical protein
MKDNMLEKWGFVEMFGFFFIGPCVGFMVFISMLQVLERLVEEGSVCGCVLMGIVLVVVTMKKG